MISALIVARNEDIFIGECIKRILPYVEEVIFVDNESEDDTKKIVEEINDEKIKIFTHEKTNDMGVLRQFSLNQATQNWIWQIDADEFYPKEACEKIVEAVKNAKNEISFRVGYCNLSWKKDHIQANFNHFPDRLYKREVIDEYSGILPNDMTKVKEGYYTYRPFLEYDNANDKSFNNPKQPILDVYYWHMARSRGYAQEIRKWMRYNCNIHNIDTSNFDFESMKIFDNIK
jgi:glycosyltransferase involved in cell wall biosynthesis